MEAWWKILEVHLGNHMKIFKRKLQALKQWIKVWNWEEFGDIFVEKRKLEELLETVHMQTICEG